MILRDWHVHTKFSSDSDADPFEVAECAVRKGLLEIRFTDHQDIGFDDKGTFTFDPEPRFEALRRVQKAFEGRLKIGIGVELGLLSGDEKLEREIRAFAAAYPWDYVIGSTHMIPSFDRSRFVDPVEDPSAYFAFPDTKAVFDCYYAFMLENVRTFDCFDTLGHLDYLTRYVPATSAPYRLADHLPAIEAILKVVIAKNKNLEINTKGLYSGLGRQNPEDAILSRYRALGGNRLVFGSDAHVPEKVGGAFDSPLLYQYQE